MSIETVVTKDATDLVCIQLEVHIWSGRRLLDKSDLIHANPEFNKLPEKDLANLGSVKICDPKEIKAFQTLKNKAETVLKRAGLPILGAIGVPSEKYPQVFKELTALKASYDQLVSEFVAAYDAKIEIWRDLHLAQHPEWTQLFRDLPTAQHVGGRLAFKFHPFRISAPADATHPELNTAFNDEIGGLKGELLREVADEAKKFVLSLSGKREGGVVSKREFITPRTLGPLRRAAVKLNSFAFVDNSIGPLSTLITDLLAEMPDDRIEGQNLIVLNTLARMLGSKRGLDELVDLALSDDTETYTKLSGKAGESVEDKPIASSEDAFDVGGPIVVLEDELIATAPAATVAESSEMDFALSNLL
jgi:hypothetical protein